MNFDNLRSAWEQEGGENVPIPDHTDKLKQAKHPLLALKKTMKNEFVVQVFSLFLMFFFPFLLKLAPSLHTFYYLGYMIMLIISTYYLVAFSRFYKQIDLFDAPTRDQLSDIYLDLRLNIERYRSWAFLLIPFLMFTIGLSAQTYFLKKGSILSASQIPTVPVFILCFASLIFMILATNWWLKFYYGKYVTQLKSILDALKEDN